MKKMLVILLNVFVATTMFTGCGKQDTSVLEKNAQESVAVSSEFEESVNSSEESNIVEDDFEGFSLDGYNYEAESNGFYIVSTYGTSLYGLVNSKGDIVIPAEYRHVILNTSYSISLYFKCSRYEKSFSKRMWLYQINSTSF